MIIPKPLFTGARVALIAPSGPVPEGRLEPAVASVQALGLEPVVFPSCTPKIAFFSERSVYSSKPAYHSVAGIGV